MADYSNIPEVGRGLPASSEARVHQPQPADDESENPPLPYQPLKRRRSDDQEETGSHRRQQSDESGAQDIGEQSDPLLERLDRRKVTGRLRPVDENYRDMLRGRKHYGQ